MLKYFMLHCDYIFVRLRAQFKSKHIVENSTFEAN